MNNNVSMRSLKIAHECPKHKVQAVSVLLWNRRSSRPLKESKSKQPKTNKINKITIMLNCQQSTVGTAGFQRSLSLKAGVGFGCQFIKRVRSATWTLPTSTRIHPPPSLPPSVAPFTLPGWAVHRGACRPAPWWSTRSLSCWSEGPGARCGQPSGVRPCRSRDAHTPGTPPEPGGSGENGGPEICVRRRRRTRKCSLPLPSQKAGASVPNVLVIFWSRWTYCTLGAKISMPE